MKVSYSGSALEQLQGLETVVRERITRKMTFYSLQQNPLSFAKHLNGFDGYRFRVGPYRIVCVVRENILYIVDILKRDDAYRDL